MPLTHGGQFNEERDIGRNKNKNKNKERKKKKGRKEERTEVMYDIWCCWLWFWLMLMKGEIKKPEEKKFWREFKRGKRKANE